MTTQLVLVFLGAIALGLLLVLWGVRGKRLNDHPVCRQCRFDLSGMYPGERTCPECGAGLVRDKSVRIGQRRKRWIPIALGVPLALAPGAMLGLLTFAMLTGRDVNSYKPVNLLLFEGRRGSETIASAAAAELIRRYDRNSLGPEQVAEIVAAALEIQGDANRPWDEAWGDLIEKASMDDLVDEADLHRYYQQAAIIELAVRPRVRIGDPVPCVLSLKERRLGSSLTIAATVQLEGATIDGHELPRRSLAREMPSINTDGRFSDSPGVGWLWLQGSSAQQWGMTNAAVGGFALDTPADLSAGPRTLRVVLRLHADAADMTRGFSWTTDPPRDRTREIVVERDVHVLDGVDPIRRIEPTPELAGRLAEALRPQQAVAWGGEAMGQAGQQAWINISVDVSSLPADVAFLASLRCNGQRHVLGPLISGEVAGLGQGYMWLAADQRHLQAAIPRPGACDLVLEPNRTLAAYTTDTEAYYGGEVVIENISIDWSSYRPDVRVRSRTRVPVVGEVMRLFGG